MKSNANDEIRYPYVARAMHDFQESLQVPINYCVRCDNASVAFLFKTMQKIKQFSDSVL